jgi:hypothetical protein
VTDWYRGVLLMGSSQFAVRITWQWTGRNFLKVAVQIRHPVFKIGRIYGPFQVREWLKIFFGEHVQTFFQQRRICIKRALFRTPYAQFVKRKMRQWSMRSGVVQQPLMYEPSVCHLFRNVPVLKTLLLAL